MPTIAHKKLMIRFAIAIPMIPAIHCRTTAKIFFDVQMMQCSFIEEACVSSCLSGLVSSSWPLSELFSWEQRRDHAQLFYTVHLCSLLMLDSPLLSPSRLTQKNIFYTGNDLAHANMLRWQALYQILLSIRSAPTFAVLFIAPHLVAAASGV